MKDLLINLIILSILYFVGWCFVILILTFKNLIS